MIKSDKLTKYVSKVTIATSISRVLGYIRDMLVAHMFGAGMFADAFYAAYRIPNLFRRLLGEGSVSASFVPVFTEYVETKSKTETKELLNIVFTTLATILLVLTLLGILFSGPLTKLIAWGFRLLPQKMDLTVSLTRIMFPYLFFACLAALLLGVHNSLKSFFLPAIAPSFLSISEIVYILFFAVLFSQIGQIKWLAVAVVIGGFGQYFIQQISIIRKDFHLRLKYNFTHPGLRKIFVLMIPAMIGFSVDQVNAFVDTICASFLMPGSITALYYSNRLMQLPLALFGIALATVALPIMSANISRNDIAGMKQTLNYSLRMACFTLIPSTCGLIVIGIPIIQILFERGRFTPEATLLTYSALAFYAIGLLAYSMVKILASAFYSFKETKVPVKVAAKCMVLNIILNIVLMGPLGVGGLALATAISSWVNLFLLFLLIRKKVGNIGGKKILNTFLKVCAASGVMSIIAYGLSTIHYPVKILVLIVPISAAVISYFLLARILKIEERQPILNLF